MRRKAKSGLSLRAREKRERQRRDILAAARGILAEDGIESVTLAAIADELGLTKQALYYYFPGKEALMGSLATSLLDEEIDAILAAVEQEQNRDRILGVLIDAFYRHYIGQLAVFRAIYCQSQLATWLSQGFDEETLRSEVNPRTRHLFDVLESRLSRPGDKAARRREWRLLAFNAWLAALGLVTMLGVTDALNDPLIYSDRTLLKSMKRTFDRAVAG